MLNMNFIFATISEKLKKCRMNTFLIDIDRVDSHSILRCSPRIMFPAFIFQVRLLISALRSTSRKILSSMSNLEILEISQTIYFWLHR